MGNAEDELKKEPMKLPLPTKSLAHAIMLVCEIYDLGINETLKCTIDAWIFILSQCAAVAEEDAIEEMFQEAEKALKNE